MARLILKQGREKSLLRKHPWVFSGAISRVDGSPKPGETVEITSSSGEFLAWAAYSPASQIQARVWSFDPKDTIGPDFYRRRLEGAQRSRQFLVDSGLIDSNAMRLVHAESDGLPGFILDRYGEVLVMQVLSAGAEYWRDTLVDLSLEIFGGSCLYERSDVDARRLEGLEMRTGAVRGGEPPKMFEIHEGDMRMMVDVCAGHKTGYYLDQRLNRSLLRSLAHGRTVLDCFSYTGGFSISAALGGAASVLSIDSSAESISLARENLQLNPNSGDRVEWLEADVFQALRKFRDSRRSFDLIVLDPPKFAQTASQVERAARGYKDINLLAFKLLNPGGLLFTFSCSGGISEDLFQKIVAGAALDAGVDARILLRMAQGPDHPIALHFPEGAYLKGLVCQI